MTDKIYLDYASSTPLDPAVKRSMDEAELLFANPSASSSMGRLAKERLETARWDVAKVLGAKRSEIIFISGGTEADNMAIFGIARANAEAGKHIITTQIEHKAVLESVGALAREGFEAEMIKVSASGVIDLADLEHKIRPDTILVSIGLANNEIGTIQPLAEVMGIIKKVRASRKKNGHNVALYLHTDASAAVGQLGLAVSRLGVDAMSLNATKIYGPKGSGALYLRTGTNIKPIIVGGGQEGGRRAGTENLVGAVGLAEALKIAEQVRASETKELVKMRDELIKNILTRHPEAILNGPKKKRLAGNINLSFAGADGEDLVARLDAMGVIVATGAACTAASEEPSYVLRAIGRSKAEAQGSLRISMGRQTTQAQLDILVRVLGDLLGDI